MTLNEYSSVERWFDDVFSSGIRSKSTEKSYLHFLGRFCKFADMDPDTLIDARREDLKSGEIWTQRKHEELLKKWRNQLEQKEGLARGSVVTANNIIKSFYKANYTPLNLKAPKTWKTRIKKVPTPEELGLMVKKGCRKNRDRAVVLGLSQTGISIEDFLGRITYGTIKKEFEKGVEPLHIPIVREKTKKHYDTFFGVDTLDALTKYFEDIKPRGNKPLFPSSNISGSISTRAVEYIVEKVSKRVRLTPHVTPHGLRAFFSTFMSLSFLQAATKHLPIVDYWMGHVIPYKGAYMVPPVDTSPESETPSQRKLYKAHEWAISIPK